MKRDLDLIRDILLKVEELSTGRSGFHIRDLVNDEHSMAVVQFHLELLDEAKLIKCVSSGGEDEIRVHDIYRLTWEGCEFLDLVRENKRWTDVKGFLGNAGTFTFEIAKVLLVEAAKTSLLPQFLELLK